MSRYEWVIANDGTKLFQIGVLADGSLYNPNGYPEAAVRAALTVAHADQMSRMPWTRDAFTPEEQQAWLATRQAAGAAIDIQTCELGCWYASDDGDPYGLTDDDACQVGKHRFVRSPVSNGWVHEGDLPLEKARAMYDRIETEAEARKRPHH